MFAFLCFCSIALCILLFILKSNFHWNFFWKKIFFKELYRKNSSQVKVQNYKLLSLRIIHDLSATLEDNNIKSEQHIAFLPLIIDLRRQGELLIISMNFKQNRRILKETKDFVSTLLSLENGLKKLRSESMAFHGALNQ